MGYDTLDGLYDCAWSEANENILVAACGDGSLKVYDLALPPQANPVRVFKEHTREVRCAVLLHAIAAACNVHLNAAGLDAGLKAHSD